MKKNKAPTTPQRAFIAIDLLPETRKVIGKLIDILKVTDEGRKVRWLWPDTLHITVRFLGPLLPSKRLALVPDIQKALHKLPPFKINFLTIAPFPNMQHASVIAVEVAYSDALQSVFNAIETAVVAHGFKPEPRPLRPHLSIGRLKSKNTPHISADLRTANISMTVRELTLFSSRTEQEGAHYTPLDVIRLGRE